MTKILLSHPHVAAVAHGFAASLERAGLLSTFATGVAFHGKTWKGRLASRLASRQPVLRNRIMTDVAEHRLRSLALVELGARAAGWAWAFPRAGAATVTKPYDLIFTAHDAAVALMRWPSNTTDVFAYEDSALWTFQRAARAGLGRIWDLPLPHYQTIEELYRDESRRWPDALEAGQFAREPEWKRRRKDGELRLATKVSVASDFTRSSLQRFGVAQPIVVVPYGFPVEDFSPRAGGPRGVFTVLSVGTHDLRKGTPYLLEAWRLAALPDAELHLVGPMRLSARFLRRYSGMFRHWPHVPKSELAARYAAADLLAFPTLGDGFGLVIQEAMCCATPVVTTSCGGGPECITDGVNGWLVPPRNIEALVDRIRRAAADRDQLVKVGKAARTRAEQWTWQKADDALANALGSRR